MRQLMALISHRELIYYFTMRDIKGRFKQSALGMWWLILRSIANVLVITVVFSYIAKFPSEGIPYPLFSYGALLPWTFFSTAITSGIPILTSNSNLVTKIYFPREILPISSIFSVLFDTCISALVFVILLIFYKVKITFYILYLIPVVVILFIFSLGLVFLLCAIHVWYRDVGQASGIVMQFWMYLTPIVYPLSLVPEKIKPFYVLNPMVGIIEGFRNALLKGIRPDMGLLGISAFISVIIFVIGYSVFKSKEYEFSDVI